MKTTTKTIKGWANNSDLLFSQNTRNKAFTDNLNTAIQSAQQNGFSKHKPTPVSHKLILKGWHWKGSWNDPTKQTVLTLYK
jgi:hypothetical protein